MRKDYGLPNGAYCPTIMNFNHRPRLPHILDKIRKYYFCFLFISASRATALFGAVLLVCSASIASAQSQISCGSSSSIYQCSYKCNNRSWDVPNINSAIETVASHGGGIVNLAPGICHVAADSVVLANDVWLKGSGSGDNGTILKRRSFLLDSQMVQAPWNNSMPMSHDIKITDLTIDPGPLVLSTISQSSFSTGATQIALPSSAFTETLGASNQCPAGNCYGNGVNVFDLSNPTSIVAPAGGNISTIQSVGGTTYINLTETLTGPVNQGDVLVFYASAGGISLWYVDNLRIDRVRMLHGSGISLNDDNNFVVANSNFITDDPLASFASKGFLLIADWANMPSRNVNGIVYNNTFFHNGMEVDSSNTIVSNNNVTSSFNGGINGGIGINDVFQGNIVHDSLNSFTEFGYTINYNHDYLQNPAMQIWNPSASLLDNIVYNNGGSGILAGGSNSIVARNVAYDNATSPDFGDGASGIFIQGAFKNVTGSTVVSNISCNTNGNNKIINQPNCITGSGSQKYAFSLIPLVVDIQVARNNQLYAGSSGLAISSPSSTTFSYSSHISEGTISAVSCTIDNSSDMCSAYVQWNAKNDPSVSLSYVSSDNPGSKVVIANQPRGALKMLVHRDEILSFILTSSQNRQIASATIEPVSSTTNVTTWP